DGAGRRFRPGQATAKNLGGHIFEFPSLMHGPQLHFAQEIAGQIECRFHVVFFFVNRRTPSNPGSICRSRSMSQNSSWLRRRICYGDGLKMAQARRQALNSTLLEVIGITLLVVGVLLLLALISYTPGDVPAWLSHQPADKPSKAIHNFVGPLGAVMACASYF